MRYLLLGRPPAADWALPSDAEVVVCGTGVLPAAHYTAVEVADIADLEQLLFALRHTLCDPADVGALAPVLAIDAVYCDYEHAMVNAAVIGMLTGARVCMPVEQAMLGRDKLRQKELVAAAGLATAPVALAAATTAPAGTAALGTVPVEPPPAIDPPLVVKPALGSAARQVVRVDAAADVTEVVDTLAAHEPALLEGFVDGPELHLDVIVAGGRLALLSVGAYLTNVMETCAERPTGSRILPVAGHEDLYDRAETFAARCAATFGITDGVLHLEAFDTVDGLVFSECGLRRAGGKSSETVALATGAPYREWACLASLRLLAPRALVRPHRSAAWAMIRVEPGRVEALPHERDFAGLPGLVEVGIERRFLGERVAEMSGAYERLGHVITVGSDAASSRAAVEQAVDVFRLGTRVRPDGTDADTRLSPVLSAVGGR